MGCAGSNADGMARMNTGREPMTNDDDAAPVEMLAQLFEAHGWPCEFVSDDEISGEIQGSWTKYQMRCIWRAEDRVLQLLCLPEIRVPDAKRADAFELLGLINEQLWLGHFDIWSRGLLWPHRTNWNAGSKRSHSETAASTAICAIDRLNKPSSPSINPWR